MGGTWDRADVDFDSDGTRCAAWLYRPVGVEGPVPLVVMAHGLGAVREWRLDAFAERFAEQGWAVLVFDYRYLGASGGEPRQMLDIGAQLADWRAALAFGRSLPGVDSARIAVWGTSFGGGHALSTAAQDHGVAAVVAQCPFTSGPASLLSRIRSGPVSALWLGVAAVVDAVRARFGARPLLMPMAGVWWMPAFLVARGAMAGAARLVPEGTVLSRRASAAVGRLGPLRRALPPDMRLSGADGFDPAATPVGRDSIWGVLNGPGGSFAAANALAARLVLRLPFYRPGADLGRIIAPVLLSVCDRDSAAPAATTRRYAEGHAHVQVRRYDLDHFDIYIGDAFEQAVADQTEFLAKSFA
ncbi:alpha/beta hydrolase [Actinokineospora sp. G85]|uniref:alpha/beta hydrolase n=1 Tax=Actinokineospora sp. G85 TaxID=3406626 RepID=UPI003C72E2B0